MKFGYYLSSAAESDIHEIITYIAQENPTAAYKFLDALYNAMEKLAGSPHLGHLNGIILLYINQCRLLKLSEY